MLDVFQIHRIACELVRYNRSARSLRICWVNHLQGVKSIRKALRQSGKTQPPRRSLSAQFNGTVGSTRAASISSTSEMGILATSAAVACNVGGWRLRFVDGTI